MKSIKHKDITFYPGTEFSASHIDPPKPASAFVPHWFKNQPKYSDSNGFTFKNGKHNLTSKSCLPLVDGFTSGYIFSTPFDIQVNRYPDGSIYFEHAFVIPHNITPFVNYRHGEGISQNLQCPWDYENFEGYDKLQFNWMPYWGMETPKKYSCIVTHPINRLDLPFYTLGGVMDTDGWGVPGNHPFLLKKGWSGFIPAGTPFMQVIPFKRENWKSKVNNSMVSKTITKIYQRDKFIKDYYKNNVWESKTYR